MIRSTLSRLHRKISVSPYLSHASKSSNINNVAEIGSFALASPYTTSSTDDHNKKHAKETTAKSTRKQPSSSSSLDHFNRSIIKNKPAEAEIALESYILQGGTPTRPMLHSLLGLYAQHGDSRRSMDILRKMIENKPPPNEYTYGYCITSLKKTIAAIHGSTHHPAHQLKHAHKAMELFNEMKSRNLPANRTIYNELMDCFGKSGDVDTAFTLFNQSIAEGIPVQVHTFSILLKACAMAGQVDTAFYVVEKLMPKYEVNANAAIWNGLLAAQQNLDDAYEVFHKMLDQGITPDTHTERTLAKLFASNPQFAAELVVEARRAAQASVSIDDDTETRGSNTKKMSNTEQYDTAIATTTLGTTSLSYGPVDKIKRGDHTDHTGHEQQRRRSGKAKKGNRAEHGASSFDRASSRLHEDMRTTATIDRIYGAPSSSSNSSRSSSGSSSSTLLTNPTSKISSDSNKRAADLLPSPSRQDPIALDQFQLHQEAYTAEKLGLVGTAHRYVPPTASSEKKDGTFFSAQGHDDDSTNQKNIKQSDFKDNHSEFMPKAMFLDLHGHSQAAALVALTSRLEYLVSIWPEMQVEHATLMNMEGSLSQYDNSGQQFVIITGIGKGSPEGIGVLKNTIKKALLDQNIGSHDVPGNSGRIAVEWNDLKLFLDDQREKLQRDKMLNAVRLRSMYIAFGVAGMAASALLIPKLSPWL